MFLEVPKAVSYGDFDPPQKASTFERNVNSAVVGNMVRFGIEFLKPFKEAPHILVLGPREVLCK
eukprot:4017535-Amphidinium_carterae.1